MDTPPRKPGRPAIGRRIGPFSIPDELRQKIDAYQQGEGFEKQADALRALLADALKRAGY